MSPRDVFPGEMDRDPELDDATVDRLLAGDPGAAAAHPELADVLADVRVAYRSGTPRVTGPLAAVLGSAVALPDRAGLAPVPSDVVPTELGTDTDRSSTMPLTKTRRAARFALAVVVTAIASGGLALAGALPAPSDLLGDDTVEPIEETTTTTVAEAPEEPDTETPADEYRNHGEEVSDFAHTTDLEGCEKGQAIAELASGQTKDKVCPHAEDATDVGEDGEEAGGDDESEGSEHSEDAEDLDGQSSDSGGPGSSDAAPGHEKRSER